MVLTCTCITCTCDRYSMTQSHPQCDPCYTLVIEKINYWDILPSLEERVKMSLLETQAFVVASV